MDNVFQSSLLLPFEDWPKEDLGRPTHRGTIGGKWERLGVGRGPVDLADVGDEGEGTDNPSRRRGEVAEIGEDWEVGAEGSEGDAPAAEGT